MSSCTLGAKMTIYRIKLLLWEVNAPLRADSSPRRVVSRRQDLAGRLLYPRFKSSVPLTPAVQR
eukprot:845904-Pleurochrysis_carterae.AAC.1